MTTNETLNQQVEETMQVPTGRKYAESHEWYLIDNGVVTVGITQFAADELTDITYVDLPAVGSTINADDSFGEVESVKATSELFSAIAGTVTEINAELEDHPELINDKAFEEGWMVKIKADSLDPLKELMSDEEYKLFVKNTK